MSIYEGTIGEREYAHGRDEGRTAADVLAEGNYGLTAVLVAETDGREYLARVNSDRTRAYWLGWLRGFREVSR